MQLLPKNIDGEGRPGEIFGFTQNGLDVALNTSGSPANVQLSVEDTTISDTSTGGSFAGISLVRAGTSPLHADIHNARILNARVGLFAGNNTQVNVRNSEIANNTSFGRAYHGSRCLGRNCI
jgi:hypothetical protein